MWPSLAKNGKFNEAVFRRSAIPLEGRITCRLWFTITADGWAPRKASLDALEARLASQPAMPALEGDANGAPHPDASAYAKKLTGCTPIVKFEDSPRYAISMLARRPKLQSVLKWLSRRDELAARAVGRLNATGDGLAEVSISRTLS
jgi:hypothetical protein